MVFFTSDLHLGHRNIIQLCNRPFSSIDEMDQRFIEKWNEKVTDADTVYILGDLMFRNIDTAGDHYQTHTTSGDDQCCLRIQNIEESLRL